MQHSIFQKVNQYLHSSLGSKLEISIDNFYHNYYFNNICVAKNRLGSKDQYNLSMIRTLSSMFDITEEESEVMIRQYVFTHMEN